MPAWTSRELDDPQPAAEGQGKLPDLIRLAGIGYTVPGEDERRRRDTGYPCPEKPAAVGVEGTGSASARPASERPHETRLSALIACTRQRNKAERTEPKLHAAGR